MSTAGLPLWIWQLYSSKSCLLLHSLIHIFCSSHSIIFRVLFCWFIQYFSRPIENCWYYTRVKNITKRDMLKIIVSLAAWRPSCSSLTKCMYVYVVFFSYTTFHWTACWVVSSKRTKCFTGSIHCPSINVVVVYFQIKIIGHFLRSHCANGLCQTIVYFNFWTTQLYRFCMLIFVNSTASSLLFTLPFPSLFYSSLSFSSLLYSSLLFSLPFPTLLFSSLFYSLLYCTLHFTLLFPSLLYCTLLFAFLLFSSSLLSILSTWW